MPMTMLPMTKHTKPRDFTHITETPGALLSPEQYQRFLHRHAFGMQMSSGACVLEVASGAGIGLDAWLQAGRSIVGLDYTERLLHAARRTVDARVPLLCADGQRLPLADACFDAITCFEAIYYLPDIGRFLSECQRVLAPGGVLILCQSNPDWADFVAGRDSLHYPSVAEINTLLRAAGFSDWHFYGAFPSAAAGKSVWVNQARRLALRVGVLSLAGALLEPLKRMPYGEMIPLPAQLSLAEIQAFDAEVAPIAADAHDRTHRVLYAIAER